MGWSRVCGSGSENNGSRNSSVCYTLLDKGEEGSEVFFKELKEVSNSHALVLIL